MITTKQERFEIYSKALEILTSMLREKKETFEIGFTFLDYDDGFCTILPNIQNYEFDLGLVEEEAHHKNCLEFLAENYPELIPYLPERWKGYGFIYTGDKPLEFRISILQKLIEEWKP